MANPPKPIAERFRYCPSCGAEIQSRSSSDSRFLCESCGFELHFSPVVSAAALISGPEEKLLMIRRKKEPSKGKLGIPGGFVNPGESLEEALRREVKEELNLELARWSFLGGWPNEYAYKSVLYSVNDTYFAAEAENLEALNLCHEEVESVDWIDPERVSPEELAFPSIQQAINAYLARPKL